MACVLTFFLIKFLFLFISSFNVLIDLFNILWLLLAGSWITMLHFTSLATLFLFKICRLFKL